MDERVRVICRIRPAKAAEKGAKGNITVSNEDTISLSSKQDARSQFTFDKVMDDNCSQDHIFETVGLPLLKNSFLKGYHSTIMCYGQTGSGKSYTIFGPSTNFDGLNENRNHVGLVPRVMEYIWSHISQETSENVSFSAKCSFFEIYQEKVFDLLDSDLSSNGLQVREDSKLGVFIDGIKEEAVSSSSDAHKILSIGYNNRHVGETSMNRESSRSHAVFVLTIRRTESSLQGTEVVKRTIVSRLTLVDLAGSERQKNTNALGDRLKEASQINKSLTVLGQVINSLVDGNSHVPFRDSKLTFLLRDSLGGNSKTVLIATISPIEASLAESMSTLKFAQRVKSIKTRAVVNEDTSGSISALQREIAQLRSKLMDFEASKVISTTTNVMMEVDDLPSSEASLTKEEVFQKEINVMLEQNELLGTMLQKQKLLECANQDLEEKINGSLERIKLLEKANMGLKLQMKMKEKPSSKIPTFSGSTTSSSEENEKNKQALDVLRAELQQEVAKYRYPLENVEKKFKELNISLSQFMSWGIQENSAAIDSLVASFWSSTSEQKWNEEFVVQSNHFHSQLEDMKSRFNLLVDEKFVDLCGVTPFELHAMKQELILRNCTIESMEIHKNELLETLKHLQRSHKEEMDHISIKVDSLTHQMSLLDAKNAEMMVTIDINQKELQEKEELLKVESNRYRQMEEDMKREHSELDRKQRLEINEIKKDNAVIVRKYQELEAFAKEKSSCVEKLTSEKQELEGLLLQEKQTSSNWENNLYTQQVKHESEMRTMDMELQRVNHSLDLQQRQNEELIVKKTGLEEDVAKLQMDFDSLQFERSQLEEQLENMSLQQESLIKSNEELTSLNSSMSTTLTQNSEEIDSLQKMKETMSHKIEALQTQRNRDNGTINSLTQQTFENSMTISRLKQDMIDMESKNAGLENSLNAAMNDQESLKMMLEKEQKSLKECQDDLQSSNNQLIASQAKERLLLSTVEEAENNNQSLKSALQVSQHNNFLLQNQLQESVELNNHFQESLVRSENLVASTSDELTQCKHHLEDMKELLQESEKNVESWKSSLILTKEELLALKDDMKLMEANNIDLQSRLQASENHATKLNNDLENSNNLVSTLQATIERLEATIHHNSSIMETMKCQLQEKEEKLSSLETKLCEARLRENQLQDSLAATEATNLSLMESIDALKQEKENLNDLLCSTQKEIQGLKESLAVSDKDREMLRDSLATSEKDVLHLNQSIATAQEEIQSLKKLLETSDNDLQAAKESFSESKTVVSSLQNSLASSERALVTVQNALIDAENQINSLKSCLADKEEVLVSVNTQLVQSMEQAKNHEDALIHLKNENASLQKQVENQQQEISNFCAHNNTKQKIQLHMKLKEEYNTEAKKFETTVESLKKERDYAMKELSAMKQANLDAFYSSGKNERKRPALYDCTNIQ